MLDFKLQTNQIDVAATATDVAVFLLFDLLTSLGWILAKWQAVQRIYYIDQNRVFMFVLW